MTIVSILLMEKFNPQQMNWGFIGNLEICKDTGMGSWIFNFASLTSGIKYS